MIEYSKLSTEIQNTAGPEKDDLLRRLCEIIGITRADLFEPFEPSVPSSPSAQQTLQAVEDPDLRNCLAHLLSLQERKAQP